MAEGANDAPFPVESLTPCTTASMMDCREVLAQNFETACSPSRFGAGRLGYGSTHNEAGYSMMSIFYKMRVHTDNLFKDGFSAGWNDFTDDPLKYAKDNIFALTCVGLGGASLILLLFLSWIFCLKCTARRDQRKRSRTSKYFMHFMFLFMFLTGIVLWFFALWFTVWYVQDSNSTPCTATYAFKNLYDPAPGTQNTDKVPLPQAYDM